MAIQISGKQMDLGEALTSQIKTRLEASIAKYFRRGFSANITIEKQKNTFTTDCKIHLDSGTNLQTTATENNATTSFEKAFEKFEKQLRRYTRKIKNHH